MEIEGSGAVAGWTGEGQLLSHVEMILNIKHTAPPWCTSPLLTYWLFKLDKPRSEARDAAEIVDVDSEDYPTETRRGAGWERSSCWRVT